MLCCWLRPTNPQTASTPSSTAASNDAQHEVVLLLPDRAGRGAAGCRSSRRPTMPTPVAVDAPPARAARGPCRTACADRACWRPDRASPPAARPSRSGAAPPTAGCSRRPAPSRTASHSSIAAIRIRIADLARRQLLERRGQDAHLHELRLERFDCHRSSSAAQRLVIDLRPRRSLPRALEDRLDDAVRAVAVLERGEGRRVRDRSASCPRR